MTATLTGFTESTSLLDDPAALRQRAEEDGYLYFKGRLPRQAVLDLREEILAILDADGLLDRSRPLAEAHANPERVRQYREAGTAAYGVGVPHEVYLAVQKLESFHALPHHPRLLAVYQALLGGTILPHPRHICRLMTPGNPVTPPHQDYTHIQGARAVWTCWFPLGDCPMDLGGLSILRGSHHEDVLPIKHAEGAGGAESWLCDNEREWLAQDMEAGDILTFHSLTVHRSLPNHHDRVRLSYDCRYQNTDGPLTRNSLLPHGQLATWDELYEGWTRDELKYYWRKHRLRQTPVDDTLFKDQKNLC